MTNAAPLSTFAERLVGARREAGMTQGQVAEATGFAQASVSAWESGRTVPTAPALRAIARAVPGLTLDELLDLLLPGNAA